MKPFFFLASFAVLIGACQKEQQHDVLYPLNFPAHFSTPQLPANNPLTKAAVALGEKLFFDPILSRDSSISCKSCHLPSRAFSDSVAISPGVEGRLGFRNAPSLMNAAWLDLINKDGGIVKLDLQAITPIEDHDEMAISILEVAKRLNEQPIYIEMAQQAYGRNPDAFVITRALANYLRTLVSANSLYDRYIQGDSTALSEAAIRGKKLFFSKKTNCSQCHTGFNFTNNQFENNGLYVEYKDNGRERITLQPADKGKFRVPTLRNSALTAPYMHDGSLSTLKAVLDHYNSGGKKHFNQSPFIQPLNLSEQEKSDILAFLNALTGQQEN